MRFQAVMVAVGQLTHHAALRAVVTALSAVRLPEPAAARGDVSSLVAAVRDSIASVSRCAVVAWRPALQMAWVAFLNTNCAYSGLAADSVFAVLAALLAPTEHQIFRWF